MTLLTDKLSLNAKQTIQPICASLLAALLVFSSTPVSAVVASHQGVPTFATQEKLSPEPEHTKTLNNIYKSLRLGHFLKIDIDNEFSSKLFDRYFQRLDNNRLYFLASDIEDFASKRQQLDDDLKNLDLNFAYDVYNRYQVRSQDRILFLLSELEKGLERYDFSSNDTLQTDRSEAPWAKTATELDQLWRKRLLNAAISFKLSGKTLEEANEILTKRYKSQLTRLKQVNSTDVFQMYANALTSLYGPHTQYFSPRKSENFDIDMRLSLEGIGAVLQAEYENTKITRLIPAGPAEKSGKLNPSDLIVGVAQGDDGEMVDVVGWRLDEVVGLIRGPKGSTVRLQIIPAGSENNSTKEVVLVRNTIKLEEQAAQKKVIELERNGKPHKLGLISLPTFYEDFDAARRGDPNYRSTTRDVEKLINELLADGVEGLVIDLRNNGGGSLREAINLAGLFIPQGPVVQIKDSWDQIQVKFDQDPKYFDIPLAVVVNRLSASASEIFAGAIQDYNRGIVVGSSTFGKGTVQVLHPLNAGQIKLTRAKFYRVNGASTQLKGVEPDIELPSIYDAGEIGEKHTDDAMPWDAVKALPHIIYPEIHAAVPTLTQAHNVRIKDATDYALILEQIDYQRQRAKEKTLPLNEEKLKQLREEEEKWQLDISNRLRVARNQSPLESITDLQAEANDADDLDPKDDVLLRESGEILLDLIQLSRPMTTSLTAVD